MTHAPHSPAMRSRRRGTRCRSATSSATPAVTTSTRRFCSRIRASKRKSSNPGRRPATPGGACTSPSRDRSPCTARSRSSITAPTSCNGGWITPWRSTATFSSPSISTSRKPFRGSSSPLSVASIGAAQTGPPTRARPRSRSTSPTSQSTPTNSPQHDRRLGPNTKARLSMPMIDVYATEDMFSDKHTLAQNLAKAVMRWEQVPEIPLFLDNTAAFIHDLPADSISNAAGDRNYIRVQVLTPVHVLDREKQLGVVKELTEIVVAAAGDPSLADRTWVLITESPEGGWGIDGHANTSDDIVASARAALQAKV